MQIRRVDPKSHSQTITHLHRLSFPNDKVCALAGSWWIAYDAGQPVAFAGMNPSARWCDAVYLSRCGVIPSHRGRGLQGRLITVRERSARKAGANWLITDTRANPQSSNNLIKAGFLLYEPAAPWGFRDALYWRRRLTE